MSYLSNFRFFMQGIVFRFLFNIHTAWKASKYGVVSGPYFSVIRLNMEIYRVNLHIQSEYRKIQTRKNSVFGHSSCSDIFFITIDLYFKPGLYIYILTYLIVVLHKHPVFKDFLAPFPPSSGHSALPPPTPAPQFYIFILGSSSLCFVLFWSVYRTCPILTVSVICLLLALYLLYLVLPICGIFIFCVKLVAWRASVRYIEVFHM